jgi:hypothetical protein
MTAFDPTVMVVVHELVHDVEVEWVPVTVEEWTTKATWQDDTKTVIVWGEMLLGRWWLARDEEVHPDQGADQAPNQELGQPLAANSR